MANELTGFINSVYHEPYSLVTNNCIRKTLRIRAEAKRLGKKTDLVLCLLLFRIKSLHNLPVITPHLYLVIEGKKVDVPLSPLQERKICKNIEVKPLIKVNISKMKRILHSLFSLKNKYWVGKTEEYQWKLTTNA